MPFSSIDQFTDKKIIELLKPVSKDYNIHSFTSKGANGYVFFGVSDILKTEVAIKVYFWGNDKRHHTEPRILAEIESPNIIPIYYAGYLNDDYAFFVTPFCKKGDIDDIITNSHLGITEALNLTNKILKGLCELHSRRLIHRDLKPGNIYIHDSGELFIGDFGSIKKIPDDRNYIRSSGHAILYRPPESFDEKYGFPGDIYQVGLILYQLLGGDLPYNEILWLNHAEKQTYDKIQDDFDRSKYIDSRIEKKIKRGTVFNMDTLPIYVPKSIRNIISKACHKDPQKRFSNAADFMAKINEIYPNINNWRIHNDDFVLEGDTSYKVSSSNGNISIQKKSSSGKWRNDNSINCTSLHTAISDIDFIVKRK